MLIFGIILTSLVLVSCLAVMYYTIKCKFTAGTIIMFCLAVVEIMILIDGIDRYNTKKSGDEYKTEVVKNVTRYSVDTLTIISGQDTTRTYTLTYWKDYE